MKQILIRQAEKMAALTRMTGLLSKENYHRKREINGVSVRIPSILGITCPVSEKWMVGLLERALPEKSGAFLDVGANVEKTGDNGFAGLRRIERFGIHSDLNQCDYLLIPDEQSARSAFAAGYLF